MKPLVSLVVPTYNQARYLGACLDSIYFQDYPNLQIVVLNDHSTDNTRDVLDSFCESLKSEKTSFASYYNETTDEIERTFHYRYPQKGRVLQVIHNEQNMGSTWTYNRGFHECQGKYCTYIASDDICHPSMISTMVEVLENEEIDFVYSDMIIIDDSGQILREFKQPDYDFKNCFCNWYLCGVSKLYRRELHDTYGYYNTEYLANDFECYLRFAMNGVRFKRIPQVLYSVRSHDQRQVGVHSQSNWSRLLKESCALVVEARKYKKEMDGKL